MSISIIIPHEKKRGTALLNRCLESLKDWNCEILIEEDGSVSEARNKAILRSHGDFLVLFDDDVVVRSNCISELLLPFQDDRVGIVGGVNVSFPDIGFRERISSVLFASPLAFWRSSSRLTPRGSVRETDESEVLSCVMAIRRVAFFKSSGFPLDCIPCEENVLINEVQGLGYKIVYTPFAIVYHDRPQIFLPYFRKIFHYGFGRGRMIRLGRGRMGMVWRPRREWLYYAVALVGHYFCYVLGLLWGLIS